MSLFNQCVDGVGDAQPLTQVESSGSTPTSTLSAWQHKISCENRISDIQASGCSQAEIAGLRVKDFRYRSIDTHEYGRVSAFIRKYEWLGTMPRNIQHIYVAETLSQLTGALVVTSPNAPSHLSKHGRELLLARGATISWAPSGLASSFIRWMVRDIAQEQTAVIVAYADPRAGEIGTIYQACGFIYLGADYGCTQEYLYRGRWRSDRFFRSRVAYKHYATDLGIMWNNQWQRDGSRDVILWGLVPQEIRDVLKEESKRQQAACPRRNCPQKHKYCVVACADRNKRMAITQDIARIATTQYPKREMA